MEHILKIKRIYYDHIMSGNKTWELRKDDRNYKIGDFLKFLIIDGDVVTEVSEKRFKVTYVFYPEDFGVFHDFCVMSIVPV